jgi:S1-C subfamily serine protease
VTALFEKQVGLFAMPERTDRFPATEGTDVYVKYKVSEASVAKAATWYKETALVEGMTVGPVFPTLAPLFPDGDIVALSVTSSRNAGYLGVRAGDSVVAVGGRAVTSTKGFEAALGRPADGSSRGPVTITLSSSGARRDVKFPGSAR